jgi:hypothetical protein
MKRTASEPFTLVEGNLRELDDSLLTAVVGGGDDAKECPPGEDQGEKPAVDPDIEEERDDKGRRHPVCYPPAIGEVVITVCADEPPRNWPREPAEWPKPRGPRPSVR